MVPFKKLILFLLSLLFLAPTAAAYEEIWGTLSLRHAINEEQQVIGELRRRDSENLLFAGKSSDIFRLSLSTKFDGFTYLVGAGYADFENNPSHEIRLYQFVFLKLLDNSQTSLVARVGSEHRDFSSDTNVYHRLRFKLQLNPFPQHKFGAAIYNEAFFALNGGERFSRGMNENRTGFGLRYTLETFEVYAYHTLTYLKFPNLTAHQEWLQFQFIFVI